MTTIYIKHDSLPKRHERDLYTTELSLIHQAIINLSHNHFRTILDIGAGDGRWGRMAKQWSRDNHPVLYGIDLKRESPESFDFWRQESYLEWEYYPEAFDLIVSNPPYYIAEEIICKAWRELAPGGEMVMLLRLSFQAGIGRWRSLWNQIPPYKVGVLSRRPSFYGSRTNGTDYGLFYWGKTLDGGCQGNPRKWEAFLVLHDRGDG